MNPHHNMLADRLKGHSYKMSHWQYMEAQEHMDPELRWVVGESIVRFREHPETFDKDRRYRPWELIKTVISAAAGVLIERLAPDPDSGRHFVDLQVVQHYAMEVYRKFDHVRFEIMEDISDLLLIYIVHDIITQIHYHTRYHRYGV